MDPQKIPPFTRGSAKHPAHKVLVPLALLLILPGALACAFPSLHQQPPVSLRPHPHMLQTSPTTVLRSLMTQPLYSGSSAQHEIALTFDDGPQPVFTPQVLAILQHFHVKATFFDVGKWMKWHPQLAVQEAQDGHEVEDHTWSHPVLPTLSSEAIHNELARDAQKIQKATDTTPTFFRPPYGETNATVADQARQLGLSTVMWSVDPRDWTRPGADAIARRVLQATTNGSIILLHDGGGDRSQTVEALPTIINTLQQRGLQFVTIQQMSGGVVITDTHTTARLTHLPK